MCGIAGIFNIQKQTPELRKKALRMSQRLRHRGPDWSGIYCGHKAILAHERLSIVDPESGRQPLFSPNGKQSLAVNGEIYNHQDIRRRMPDYEFQTGSTILMPIDFMTRASRYIGVDVRTMVSISLRPTMSTK